MHSSDYIAYLLSFYHILSLVTVVPRQLLEYVPDRIILQCRSFRGETRDSTDASSKRSDWLVPTGVSSKITCEHFNLVLLGTFGQFAQEGYNVVHLTYPLSGENASFKDAMKVVSEQIIALGADWGLLTYGLTTKDAETLVSRLALSLADLKACAHFCPDAENTHGFLVKDNQGRHIP